MITTILFDLDGTLISMDQDEFVRAYFVAIEHKIASAGVKDAPAVTHDLGQAIVAMMANDGTVTNEDRFWAALAATPRGACLPERRDIFDDFYANDFSSLRSLCGVYPASSPGIETLAGQGFRLALATNPLFPATATRQRIQWGGLDPGRFERITTYENSRFCKPRKEYFREVADRLGVSPVECLMVGNDTADDYGAVLAGMSLFFLTPGLIDRGNLDLSAFPHGTFDDLLAYAATLS